MIFDDEKWIEHIIDSLACEECKRMHLQKKVLAQRLRYMHDRLNLLTPSWMDSEYGRKELEVLERRISRLTSCLNEVYKRIKGYQNGEW